MAGRPWSPVSNTRRVLTLPALSPSMDSTSSHTVSPRRRPNGSPGTSRAAVAARPPSSPISLSTGRSTGSSPPSKTSTATSTRSYTPPGFPDPNPPARHSRRSIPRLAPIHAHLGMVFTTVRRAMQSMNTSGRAGSIVTVVGMSRSATETGDSTLARQVIDGAIEAFTVAAARPWRLQRTGHQHPLGRRTSDTRTPGRAPRTGFRHRPRPTRRPRPPRRLVRQGSHRARGPAGCRALTTHPRFRPTPLELKS